MGEYARPIEVRGGKGVEGAIRAPEIGTLSGPADEPDCAGRSLGAALGEAVKSGQPPSEEPVRLGPIGRLRQAAEALTANVAERLRSVGAVAEKVEGDRQQATGRDLSELKQRALEIFTACYRASGPEAEAQKRDFARSRERFDLECKSALLRQTNTGNGPPPLETEGLTPQPNRARGLDRQEEQKHQIRCEGRSLGN